MSISPHRSNSSRARLYAAALMGAFVLILVYPTEAAACACCDGGDSAVVLGFTDGDAMLVERHGTERCQSYDRLEVWRPGAASPVRCFDLNSSTPNRPLPCDEWEHADTFDEPSGAAHPRRRFFANAPRYLAPSHVRASLRRYPEVTSTAPAAEGDDEAAPDDIGRPTHTLVVEVRTNEGVQRVLSADIVVHAREMDDVDWQDENAPDGRFEEYEADDAPSWSLPPPTVDVQVVVGPTGNHLALLVRGHDSTPGIGHFATMVYGSAVQGLDPNALLSEAPMATLAIPVWETPARETPPGAEAGTVDRFNRWALALHARGRYDEAAMWWTRLLALAPTDANVRYNLACAQARLGNPERALELLSDLQQRSRGNACRPCAERMRRARRDPDLATVRALPGYAAMLRAR